MKKGPSYFNFTAAKMFLILICFLLFSCQEEAGVSPVIVFETDFANTVPFVFSQEIIDPGFDGTATASIVNGEILLTSMQGSPTHNLAYSVATFSGPIAVPSATRAINVTVHWEISMADRSFTEAMLIINGKTIYLDEEATSLNTVMTTTYSVKPSANSTLQTMIFKLREFNDAQPSLVAFKIKSITVSQ